MVSLQHCIHSISRRAAYAVFGIGHRTLACRHTHTQNDDRLEKPSTSCPSRCPARCPSDGTKATPKAKIPKTPKKPTASGHHATQTVAIIRESFLHTSHPLHGFRRHTQTYTQNNVDAAIHLCIFHIILVCTIYAATQRCTCFEAKLGAYRPPFCSLGIALGRQRAEDLQ